jgi:hypothetical protein
MIGHKKLSEVRAELEAALGGGPPGTGEVAESLRRFLAAGTVEGNKASSNPAVSQDAAKRDVPAAIPTTDLDR